MYCSIKHSFFKKFKASNVIIQITSVNIISEWLHFDCSRNKLNLTSYSCFLGKHCGTWLHVLFLIKTTFFKKYIHAVLARVKWSNALTYQIYIKRRIVLPITTTNLKCRFFERSLALAAISWAAKQARIAALTKTASRKSTEGETCVQTTPDNTCWSAGW